MEVMIALGDGFERTRFNFPESRLRFSHLPLSAVLYLMASSDGSTRGSTSSTFATDITNTVSTTRNKSSSSRALTAPTKRTRHVFRQTSLTFGPLSSSPVSTSSTTCASTPLFSDETDVSSSALIETRPSSPLATSPSVGGAREGVDHDKMDLDDEEDAQDPEQDESTNKRRRLLDAFDSPRLVSSMDLDKGKRKMETMYTMSGTQMSVFKAAQRRALGFKTIPGHGLCFREIERRSDQVLTLRFQINSIGEADFELLCVQQRGASLSLPVDATLSKLCPAVRLALFSL